MREWYVTGDTHGNFDRIISQESHLKNSNLIVLGDSGLNYYKNLKDMVLKNKITQHLPTTKIYIVRGNHEERPENIPTMREAYDANVDGTIYMEEEWPNIRYLMDGRMYLINSHPTLVIGGAYSVDKYYRLARGWNWFPSEQLTEEEMSDIEDRFTGKSAHIILTHTCPLSWQPTDLFLPQLDQSTVDNSMEIWLEGFKEKIDWSLWLFGHYHADREVQPGVHMLFKDIEELESLFPQGGANGVL